MTTNDIANARLSVLTAIVIHAAFNTVPMSGLLVAVVLIVVTRGRLSYDRDAHPTLRFRSPPNIGLQPTARGEVQTRRG